MTPKQKRRLILILILLLLLIFILLGLFRHELLRFLGVHRETSPEAPTVPIVVTPVTPLPGLTKMLPSPSLPTLHPIVKPIPTPVMPKPIPVTPVQVSTPTPVIPVPPVKPVTPVAPIPPGQEGMHRELIPKEITIVRCYYDEEVVAPGETFGFDINGSGFTETFQQMITVNLDGLDLAVKNLSLATPNQIHGQIEVGPEATTQYDYPIIYIRNLPVFKAPEPFGVVRHGEVLDVMLTDIDDSGQYGKFQVITNLDDALFEHFKVTSTTPKLEISNVKPLLPFHVKGDISIAPGLSSGAYGLVVAEGTHELFRKDPLVDVVRPNVGKTGSVESLKAVDLAHRPGDDVQIIMKGSGFIPSEMNRLTSKVDEFEMGSGSFTWVTGGRVDFHFQIPMGAPVGIYGMTILDKGKEVFEKKAVFGIVPANWLAGVTLPQPITPGSSGVLQLKGRDIAPDLVATLQILTDEPHLQISNIRWQDPSTLIADVKAGDMIAPGDYLLDIELNGKHKTLPQGSLIKITR